MPSSSTWSGSPSIRGPTESVQMALLTYVLIGMVVCWGVEMTYCTPYLLQLGLTKSKISLVLIAGPLSGLFVQPIIGAVADRSTSKFGRRRPFMLGAAVIVGLAFLMLGWTSEVVGAFISTESTKTKVTIAIAVVCIWIVDFSINAVQACSRALIVDTLPINKQSLGAAWDVRMGAAGHVVVSMIGRLDLVKVLPGWLGGDTQFKKMTVFAAFSLWSAVIITSYAVKERILLTPASGMITEGSSEPGLRSSLRSAKATLLSIFQRIRRLPTKIQAICWVQFWSWIGWYPFLFYGSTWVGETYYRYQYHIDPGSDPANDEDTLGTVGRLGSTALGIFSVIVFGASLVLPRLVQPSTLSASKENLAGPSSSASDHSFSSHRSSASRVIRIARDILAVVANHRPNVATIWLISELLYGSIMLWAPLVRSVAVATLLISLAGVPWAVSIWAPFALMGVEINRLAIEGTSTENTTASLGPGGYTAVRRSTEEDEDTGRETELEAGSPERTSSRHRRRSSSGVLLLNHPDEDDSGATSSTGELAGIYIGVLNVYSTLPQFVATALSWVVFSILQVKRNDDDTDDGTGNGNNKWLDLAKNGRPNAIGVCLFIGALAAIVAAEAARRLRKLN